MINMVVFNHIRRALESLATSTHIRLVYHEVEAAINGRNRARVSRRTVEFSPSSSPAMARNMRAAIAFEPPSGDPPPLDTSYLAHARCEWQQAEVPATLLEGLRREFLRYFDKAPWSWMDRIVTVWVAMPVVVGWFEDGSPRYQVAEQPQPEPEPDGQIVPPLDPPLDFHNAIERARQAGACQGALEALASMTGWDEFARHPQAPEWAYWFASNVMRDRVRRLEPIIATDPYWACLYARDVVRGRWPGGEPAIAQDPEAAYRYAADVIRASWPQGEPTIAKSPEWACLYAERVVGGPWPERAE